MTREEMRAEADMLKGNINRICVTDDIVELVRMREFAMTRIDNIFSYRYQELQRGEWERRYGVSKIPDKN